MYEALNKKLIDTKEKLRERDKLQSKLDKAKSSLRKEREKLTQLESNLQKEQIDVKKMESLSLTGLFYTILGNKNEKIEKEKQEFLAAKLKYDESMHAVSILEKEVQVLDEYLTNYNGIDQEYHSLIKEKENLIINHHDENGKKLLYLSEKLTDLKSDIKELNEAIDAGRSVNYILQEMENALQSAKNWGTWDMLGGGLLATAAKHSKIDDAKHHAHQAQSLLRKFQHELEDVNVKVDVDINISSFDTFADYFFDGLIFDWVVQSKINRSLDNVVIMRREIENINQLLTSKTEEAKKIIAEIENEINTIIEEA